jgi:hypothetical protein
VEFVAEGLKTPDAQSAHQRMITVSGKYNMVPVTTFAQEDIQQWIAEGQLSTLSGEKLIESKIQAIPLPNVQQQKFLIRVTGTKLARVSPYVVIILEQQPSASNGTFAT